MSRVFETGTRHQYLHRQYFGKVSIYNSSTSELTEYSFTTQSFELSWFFFYLHIISIGYSRYE